ncbi:copper homeostasis protein [Microbacterium resistens]|uniref:PF03932 family protein CutC n=1 Tax=Microbacterium resistens TaxID=156977 RepID=A0ABU1SD23_9MICO|nr:copper homeostasis protein CutC [Microbacterium resistens]MDR6867138.1 copper homeostasis protein [Microbacterium resistens]
MTIALEVAVQDAAGVRVAREIGAARVELAQALPLGGLTPSPATLAQALEASGDDGPEIHVLVRPRAGGFHYDAEELAASVHDIRVAVGNGAAGVVIGALDADGRVDVDALARLRDAADGAPVTLHRAIDVTPDPLAALAAAIDLGFARVLTSGGSSAAIDGLDMLRALVALADGRIQVMAGSGVNAETVAEIAATGVDAVHFSAKRTVLADGGVRMGSADDGVGGHEVTDLDRARAVRRALGL